MRHYRKAGLHLIAAGSVIALTAMVSVLPASAAPTPNPGPAGLLPVSHSPVSLGKVKAATSSGGGGESEEILDGAAQFAAVRTAPAASVSPAAFTAAVAQASQLPLTGGGWREVTDQPYNSDAVGYRDPVWSNSSGGAGLVAGRMTALAIDGRILYAGAAGGGVWRSTNGGTTWTPVFDQQNDLSVGALAVNPADHSIWVGTGEANTNQDSYTGNGIYRSADQGRTWQLVGNSLPNYLIYQITFDRHGHVYAATSRGLVRRSSANLASSWDTVLKPDPNPTNSPYRTSFITDVKVQPGTDGKVVIAALGWRGGTVCPRTSHSTASTSPPTGGQHLHQAHPHRRPGRSHRHRPHHVRLLGRRQDALRTDRVHRRPSPSRACTSRPARNPAGPWKLHRQRHHAGQSPNSALALSGRGTGRPVVVQPGAHRGPGQRQLISSSTSRRSTRPRTPVPPGPRRARTGTSPIPAGA